VRKGKTIVLGLGNLLLGDEGVGVHAIRYLQAQKVELPPEVELVDGGTAGLDLLPILEGAEQVIIVDAVRAGGAPGSIYRLGPEALRARGQSKDKDQDQGDNHNCNPNPELEPSPAVPLSLHQLSLEEVLRAGEFLGMDILPKITIIGVEPKRIAPTIELSSELERALPRLIEAILEEIGPNQA